MLQETISDWPPRDESLGESHSDASVFQEIDKCMGINTGRPNPRNKRKKTDKNLDDSSGYLR